MLQKIMTIALSILTTFSITSADIAATANSITLENDVFKRVWRFSSNEAAPIILQSIYDKSLQRELPLNSQAPFFECVIEKTLITSQNPIWIFTGHDTRDMGNGGEEITLNFVTTTGPVKGLSVRLIQQIFPNTSLVREKLELFSEEKTFRLFKRDGELHFKFPHYAFEKPEPAHATEIRIATWGNELIEIDKAASFDERFMKNPFDDFNLANCHMYHPQVNEFDVTDDTLTTKGPINILHSGDLNWISAYEHASQDNLNGLIRRTDSDDLLIRDGLQGTKGVFNFELSDEDFHFLGFSQRQQDGHIDISIDILKGGYLDGEKIDPDHSNATVWTASAFHFQDMEKSKSIIRDYLWRCICEKPASRRPEFYYNTWGMQRKLNSMGEPLRGVFTEDKIIQEIRYAADLGVDLFVLDDGWEQTQGVWRPHRERLPNGLTPITEELDKHGIKMGVWFSPMGIDSAAQRYTDHPEWVVLDSEGHPIRAQWNHPAFDFVSDFYDVFIEDCKWLIDQGARFFKWDAINTFYSALPNLHHGDDNYSDEEIRARYEYLLPIYVTNAMKELTDYEPELVIEIDLTEARRVMVGLAVLSQGKYFWMNNGASGYNDYSVFRAKSMRTIPNQFGGWIPLELFTYANYPHNDNKAQRYNVNTSLISGHGFWGALQFMKERERQWVGAHVAKSKRVLPFVADVRPDIIGRVGASPEIYTQVNREHSAGQVIAFSGSALNYRHTVKINPNRFLGVLNHSYALSDSSLVFNFDFPMPDATREAFILPNNGTGISILSSTCCLDDIKLTESELSYKTGASGTQLIQWPIAFGQPTVEAPESVKFMATIASDSFYHIKITTESDVLVTLKF